MLERFSRRGRAWFLTVAVVCLATNPATAQTGSLQHQSWSTEAGLPQNSVHQVLQTEDGYLWLATEGGVVRYDGVSFTVFDVDNEPALTSNDITSLAQDQAGTLWIGTADGLVSVPRGTLLGAGNVPRGTLSGTGNVPRGTLLHWGEREGLPSASILSLAGAGDGSMLVLTAGGLVRVDGGKINRRGLPNEDFRGLQREPDGSVLLLTNAAPKLFQNGKTTSNQSVPPDLPDAIRGVQAGRDGQLWTWTDHAISCTFLGHHLEWQTGHELPGSRIDSVLVDRNGVAWIGTNRGLVTLTGTSPRVSPVAWLGMNGILSLTQDAEGNLWVGTETSGLHALRPRKFHEEPGLADEEVSCLVQAADGAMWIGTRDDGVRRLRTTASGVQLDTPVRNQALTSPVILSLAAGPDGSVWAGTPDGLTQLGSGGKHRRYTSSDGLPDDLVRSLLAEPDGTLWAGTRRGLARLQGNRWDAFTQANGLGGDLIGALFEDPIDRELWVATLGGLSVFRHGRFETFGRREGLSSSLVTGIARQATRSLWAVTRDAGLFLFDGKQFTSIHASLLPKELLSLVKDNQGFLWMRGLHGVFRASAAELAACGATLQCNAKVASYGVEDGMPTEEMVLNGLPTAVQTTAGEVWFATRKGVAIADTRNLAFNDVPPPVVLQRFLADNEEVAVAEGTPRIRSGHSRYTFDYAGLSYTAPSKVLYRFRLEGFDNLWSRPSPRRSASYTNLPAGEYTFQVQAANNDGVWNEEGVSFPFRIMPPFYRRWWFVLGLLLTIAAIVIALYRLRVRRLQRGFDAVLVERNRIAREIHDTLAQDFVAVSLQMDIVSQFLARNSVPEALQQLKATRDLVRSGLEEARQSIWNLRGNVRQDSLPARIAAITRRFAGDGLKVKLKISGVYRDLPGKIEDQVLRITQEAVSNVSRHADATYVRVQLLYEHDKLALTVQDDGRGFTVEEATTRSGHYGLKGMRERAATLEAELEVNSVIGDGSTMRLTVPLVNVRKGVTNG